MKDKMDHPENDELVAGSNDSANQKPVGVDSSRRRLFGAGIAMPVVLSMSSRTAWGGALCAPSAFNSVTFSSQNPADTAICRAPAGQSPAYWAAPSSTWPVGILPTQLFTDYFSHTPTPIPLDANSTLQEVLDLNATSLQSHAVAALLNAQNGDIDFGGLTKPAAVSMVISMFNRFLQGLSYTTTTGTEVFWYTGPSGYSMEAYFTNYINDPYP